MMNKTGKKWTIRLGSLVLAGGMLGTCAVLAASGDQDDPLITLSYLERTAIPQIVGQVEEQTAQRQAQMEREFSALVGQYMGQAGGQGGGTGSASYALVTLSGGQTMALEVGCEVLLRVGSVQVAAATSPALIDLTTGGSVESGAALERNHLYMATIADRTLTAGAGTVKLLVRGGYQIH